MQSKSIHLNSAEDTKNLGAAIAAGVKSSVVIGLVGKLGAGKTTFTQGLAQELEVEESVSSPTFLMLNEYHSGKIPLYHFDLYRLQEDLQPGSAATTALKAELDEIMHLRQIVIAVVEWIDLYEEFCAGIDELRIELSYAADGDARVAGLNARGAGAEALLEQLHALRKSRKHLS